MGQLRRRIMLEDLRTEMTDPYPNIADAMAWFEGRAPGTTVEQVEDFWAWNRAHGNGVSEVVRRCRTAAVTTLKVFPCGDSPLSKALPQMDHPEFRQYVAGKLGLT
jgi:hypothetical protein